ncbi:MAG: glycerol-3-phosphate 1-O-acyltransferase PlsY [Sphingomonadaceae bacterium]|nr:glycerol-3-phosphate 1-O-acyltransferase PlsY [Sphingomonadaceae bacterium]
MFPEPVWLAPILALLLGYLLGSIPFGLILTRMGGAGDLREIGSGNIGATNVLRTGHRGLAVATLLLDIGKGFLAVWLAARLGADPKALERLAAVGVMAGHCFSVFLRFRGGKGVATLLGVALAIEPLYGLFYALVWLMLLWLVRVSSVAGLSAVVILPLIAVYFGNVFYVMMFTAFALLVIWKHRENVVRLFRGEEPRIGESRAG